MLGVIIASNKHKVEAKKSVIEYTKFGSQHLRLAWCNPCMEIGKNG